jgi:hypothetical protein
LKENKYNEFMGIDKVLSEEKTSIFSSSGHEGMLDLPALLICTLVFLVFVIYALYELRRLGYLG